jgi:hypothetical protein
MIDRIAFSTLAIFLLVGTLAIGSELFGAKNRYGHQDTSLAQAKIVQLQPVVVHARRESSASSVAQADSAELALRYVR